MDNKEKIAFGYQAHSRAYLARAKEHLEKFDTEDDVASLFYAALDLRFSIEARLYQYMDATFKALNIDPKKSKKYTASKMLTQLLSADPDAGSPVSLRIVSEQTGSESSLHYTPVTNKLAKMHGMLGELLHFRFFRNNKRWYLRKELGGNPHKSLVNYRKWIDDVISELEQATRGNMLNNPRFTQLVERIIEEDEDD